MRRVQICLQGGVALTQSHVFPLDRIGRRSPPGHGQPRQRAGITGPSPLDQYRGVQTLAAQHRLSLTRGRRFVLGQHLQLVCAGEGSMLGPRRDLTTRVFAHGTSMGARSWNRWQYCHYRDSSPRPSSVIHAPVGASPHADREGLNRLAAFWSGRRRNSFHAARRTTCKASVTSRPRLQVSAGRRGTDRYR